VWNETGLLEKFPSENIPHKWSVPIAAGYCGPTVAQGRVYVMDRLTKPQSIERVHCLDEQTGAKIWSHEYECDYGRIGYPAGPRASVTIDNGQAFALGASGRLHVFDAASGKILWKKDLDAEYKIEMPIWGIAASPLVYKDVVILLIGGENASVIGLDRTSGKEVWKALRDRAQYSSPIIVEQAGKPVVVCWTGDSAAGLAPLTGEIYWRYPWKPRNMPIGIATPVREKDRIFFTSFYDGSLMLRLRQDATEIDKLWQIAGRDEKNTLALHSIISTPLFKNGYLYGCDSYGELRCLNADNGDRIWEDDTATPRARWSNLHFVQNGERTWLFNERGDLIIAELTPTGYHEISRTHLLEPTLDQLRQRGGVCWSHPAFANRHVFARNDKEIVCASLAAE
jgi:outer membrane protein assembly factor BamB